MSNYDINDITNSFRKLLSNTYFDSNDLYIRGQIAKFMIKGEANLEALVPLINAGPTSFSEHFKKISLRFLPKKIEEKDNEVRENLPPNFISNHFVVDGSRVKRPSIFCSLPIELHIVSIIWIIRYGYLLDKDLTSSCFGNRLILDRGKIQIANKSLFKPYVKQFKNWWSKCISNAEKLLSEKDDVTIINFDLKNYYHSVELDFKQVEKFLISKGKSKILGDPLHNTFKQIHIEYAKKLKKISHPSYRSIPNKYPLPIGMLSSYILANWYLKDFDEQVQQELIPTYYGRYVDDILIVLKGRLVTSFDKNKKDELVRKLDALNLSNEKSNQMGNGDTKDGVDILNFFVTKHLHSILVPISEKGELNYGLTLKKFKNITLQKEKFFIYQFDAKLSPSLIKKFTEDQKDRSSEFRFLSDEDDESFDDFEENVFESNFDNAELNKARFKQVEENKFRLSVYLAKFIRRLIEKGENYKSDEIDKIEKYFQGIYLLKHHYFWEKLFTLYLLANRTESFSSLVKKIHLQIMSLEEDYSDKLTLPKGEIKKELLRHLTSSVEMALGLFPAFTEINFAHEYKLKVDPTRFRKACLLRKQYIYFPLLHLTKRGREGSENLASRDLFSEKNLLKWTSTNFSLDFKWVPYRLKFYEVALFTFYKNLILKGQIQSKKKYRFMKEFAPVFDILDEAFHLFYDINIDPTHSQERKEQVRNKYFQPHIIKSKSHARGNNYDLEELYIPNNQSKNKGYGRIALINKYVDFNDYAASLKGKPNLNEERVETFHYILDEVSKIKKCDLFVQPELSLPHDLLLSYAKFSARKQIGFISGVEHFRVSNLGFNFIMSCLPVNILGDHDAIPTLRLKNHYAPIEESWMNDQFITVPKPKKYKYQLFEWRNIYFSPYYCFELADVFHRAALFSMVDLVIAPIWNQDVLYYNNIVESTTRDLHCYFVQVNASQYGETRVTRPTGHIRKDKARITGGTINDHKVTILVSDIDISSLRTFQKLRFPGQKEVNKDNKSFKPTPPDFPIENTIKRENGEQFGTLLRLTSHEAPPFS